MTGTEDTGARNAWPNRIARRIPPIVLEQPWGIFVKSLCIVTGLSTFAGPKPGSLAAALPPSVVYLWSITLVLGSACALYGLFRPKARRVEIAGLIWLGTASIVYAVAIFGTLNVAGFIAGGIVLGFGLAALVRALAVYVSYEVARSAIRR